MSIDFDLEFRPEAVLRQHLVQHVLGIGPAAAKVLPCSTLMNFDVAA